MKTEYYIQFSKKFGTLAELVEYYKSDNALSLLLIDSCKDKQLYADISVPNFSELDIWDIDKKDLIIQEELGRGNFGRVCKGKWKKIDVAIKILKKPKLDKEKKEAAKDSFEQESAIMKKLRNKHLVRLYGVSKNSDGDNMMVMELMEGSLQTYLDHGRLLKQEKIEGQTVNCLDLVKFMHIIKDISSGMTYIEKEKYVHRDLRTDNILIKKHNETYVVKIGDFGLSRGLDDEKYTIQSEKFPVKWTAPEALNKKEYTIKCDVWSFGVMIWQITSTGKMPWGDISNTECVRQVTSGNRLQKPELCPNEIWKMADKCFHHDPKYRPSFAAIGKEIDEAYSDDLGKQIYDEAIGGRASVSSGYLVPHMSASQQGSRQVSRLQSTAAGPITANS